jgi:hypothetical protein
MLPSDNTTPRCITSPLRRDTTSPGRYLILGSLFQIASAFFSRIQARMHFLYFQIVSRKARPCGRPGLPIPPRLDQNLVYLIIGGGLALSKPESARTR